jgi:Mlc titration factor MtfA (ptsG expression regulator)
VQVHPRLQALRKKPGRGPAHEYGATHEAEFFAVATSAFFERPWKLKHKTPDLHEELRRFHRLDPHQCAKNSPEPAPSKRPKVKRR